MTCGEVCQLWEHGRNEPIRTYEWGVDSLHNIAFNKIENNLLGIVRFPYFLTELYYW